MRMRDDTGSDMCIYAVFRLMAVTLSNLNRFSKFFHWLI